jgi:hypothetical protein
MRINGFAVVRLPHLNYLVPERDVIPFANGIYYAGVDRQRWASLLDEYVLAYEQSVAAEQSEPLAPPSADFARIRTAIEVGVVSRTSN